MSILFTPSPDRFACDDTYSDAYLKIEQLLSKIEEQEEVIRQLEIKKDRIEDMLAAENFDLKVLRHDLKFLKEGKSHESNFGL